MQSPRDPGSRTATPGNGSPPAADVPIPSIEDDQTTPSTRLPDIGGPDPGTDDADELIRVVLEYTIFGTRGSKTMVMDIGRDKPFLHCVQGWVQGVATRHPEVDPYLYEYTHCPPAGARDTFRVIEHNKIWLSLQGPRQLHIRRNDIIQILPHGNTREKDHEYQTSVAADDDKITRRHTRGMGPPAQWKYTSTEKVKRDW